MQFEKCGRLLIIKRVALKATGHLAKDCRRMPRAPQPPSVSIAEATSERCDLYRTARSMAVVLSAGIALVRRRIELALAGSPLRNVPPVIAAIGFAHLFHERDEVRVLGVLGQLLGGVVDLEGAGQCFFARGFD